MDETGLVLAELKKLVVMRAGTAYFLNPENYAKRCPGEEYPAEKVKDQEMDAVTVLVLSKPDVLERIRAGKFAG